MRDLGRLSRAGSLRPWQGRAQAAFMEARARNWLTTATPGAGKTTYALDTAVQMMQAGRVERVCVVVPTTHLRTQWVEAAKRFGLDLRPTPNDERLPDDADGCVVTYAQVAQKPALHRARVEARSTFAIFDEVHHAGDDKSWGQGVLEVFDTALVRFSVTGTPFRSDDARIATVTYEPTGDGGQVSVANFTYGYGDALADRVVRPITFAAYAGEAEWTNSAGEAQRAVLGEAGLSREAEELAWKTALDPDGEWIPHVFAAAWAKVSQLRSGPMPDAGVLIPASSQETARKYAEVWRQVTGDEAVLVLSDDPESGRQINAFRDDPEKVAIVCVRMVTEGVDIPRLACLTWTTTASTPLFFAQMVGRVVRARSRGERATVFLPAVRRLLGLAAAIEAERDHVIAARVDAEEDDIPLVEEPVDEAADDAEEEVRWRPVASSASFQSVTGTRYIDAQEADALFGMEGMLTPEQEALLLKRDEDERRAQARLVAEQRRAAKVASERAQRDEIIDAQWHGDSDAIPAHLRSKREAAVDSADAADLRGRIASAVSAYAQLKHLPHGAVWKQLYGKVGGPKNADATVGLLRRRLEAIQRMLG